MVPVPNGNVDTTSSLRPVQHAQPVPGSQARNNPPIVGQHDLIGMQSVWLLEEKPGLSQQAQNIILASRRASTQNRYQSQLRKWVGYCSQRGVDPLHPPDPVTEGLNFLACRFDEPKNLAHSTLGVTRSALSSVLPLNEGRTFGESELVKRFMKGVFNLRPQFPRYDTTWNVKAVLDTLKTWSTRELSLKFLTLKLVTLMALISAQRVQTLHMLRIDQNFMQVVQGTVYFHAPELLKQTRPGTHLKPLEFKPYTKDRRLCVIDTLDAYLSATRELRQSQHLFVFLKNHITLCLAIPLLVGSSMSLKYLILIFTGLKRIQHERHPPRPLVKAAEYL